MAESKGRTGTEMQNQSQQQQGSTQRGQQLQSRSPWREQGLERRGGFPDLFSASPFQMMRRMTEEMDRMFERAFSGSPMALHEGAWSPRIEAFQKEDSFIVRAELPGLKKDDVEVNVTDDAITIQGQRQHEHEEKREGFFHSERSYGSFYRTIPLPEGVIADSAKATFRDGVLEIKLQAPPNEVTRGRRVEVTDGGEASDKGQSRK
jgi:HSP20 family protein